jgi:hypothetical protein
MESRNMIERFPAEYFSGCDVRIYFNDILIDEIVQLKFALQEQVMPVYGYNSHNFDDVFHGAKIVTGSLAINFKDSSYLLTAAEQASKGRGDDYKADSPTNVYGFDELNDAINDGAGSEFDKLAENNIQRIWGYNSREDNSNKRNSPKFDASKGFDIKIAYGAYNKSYGNSKLQQAQENHAKNSNAGNTVKAINNVHLTSTGQTIELSGQPVKEVYTFIAEDLDKG